MADIKTHLRELSVATTVGLLNAEIEVYPSDLMRGDRFFAYAKQMINNDISSANNLVEYAIFSDDLQMIIENGYKLGKKIYENSYFHFKKNDEIKWLGNDTQKGDPIDITIGKYGFSLKEESFILKNMGFYQLLNNLTGSNYQKGIHIFEVFAKEEYDKWFAYTWKSFYEYLQKNITWELENGRNISKAFIDNYHIVLCFNDEISNVPIDIKTNKEFMSYTSYKTREKVFAKWIKMIFSTDETYISLKKICSETAGKRVSQKINCEFKPNNIYDFFQIYLNEYYYAKTTINETTILKVPSRTEFTSVIEFQGCRYEVPASQLNLITTFKNRETGKILEFRNECRFSHGQFNGTPEAKMYVAHNTPLTDLYIPL